LSRRPHVACLSCNSPVRVFICCNSTRLGVVVLTVLTLKENEKKSVAKYVLVTHLRLYRIQMLFALTDVTCSLLGDTPWGYVSMCMPVLRLF
jgi:hypothetical protein